MQPLVCISRHGISLWQIHLSIYAICFQLPSPSRLNYIHQTWKYIMQSPDFKYIGYSNLVSPFRSIYPYGREWTITSSSDWSICSIADPMVTRGLNSQRAGQWWGPLTFPLLLINQAVNTLRPRQNGRHLFPRRHFQMLFLEWKCKNFAEDFTKVCS